MSQERTRQTRTKVTTGATKASAGKAGRRASAATPLGTQMKEARKAKGLAQEDLARLIGCHRSTIAMIEIGGMAGFDDHSFYEKIAKQLGKTAKDWSDLADRSKRTVHLPVGGETVTEEHRKVGVALADAWEHLPPDALKAIKAVIAHAVASKKSGPKDGEG